MQIVYSSELHCKNEYCKKNMIHDDFTALVLQMLEGQPLEVQMKERAGHLAF